MKSFPHLLNRITFISLLVFATTPISAMPPTDLFLRGYSVIPAPRRVDLQSGDIDFDGTWVFDAAAVGTGAIFRALLGPCGLKGSRARLP
jgi:hypothetical protein